MPRQAGQERRRAVWRLHVVGHYRPGPHGVLERPERLCGPVPHATAIQAHELVGTMRASHGALAFACGAFDRGIERVDPAPAFHTVAGLLAGDNLELVIEVIYYAQVTLWELRGAPGLG